MPQLPKVAIVYLSFNCEPYMDDVVGALRNITYPKDCLELVIVDNPHPEYGPSVRFLEENVMPLSGRELPHVTLLPQSENTGFAGGNNIGAQWALEHGFDYVFFHNNDGFLASNALEPLVNAMEADKTIGAAQSLMLLHPETDLVNSTGNAYHYLGFGYCNEYRTKAADLHLPAVSEVAYASGAALLMRADLMEKYGLWDEDYFLYHEDLEWSMRLRLLGYRAVMVRDSVFYHKYQFSRSITKYYWMERNRYGFMLSYFRLPTLLVLMPMWLVLEAALVIFSFKNGWWRERLRVYKYWFNWSNVRLWLKKRQRIQAIRQHSDRSLLHNAAAGIYFQDTKMESPLLKYVGNPLMTLYFKVVVKGLIWW